VYVAFVIDVVNGMYEARAELFYTRTELQPHDTLREGLHNSVLIRLA
jgi:hypothetical protein